MVHYGPFAIGDDAGNLPSSGGGGLGDSVAGIAIKHLTTKTDPELQENRQSTHILHLCAKCQNYLMHAK